MKKPIEVRLAHAFDTEGNLMNDGRIELCSHVSIRGVLADQTDESVAISATTK